MDAATRFERYYIPEPNSGCWLWTGALSKTGGYGRFDWKPAGLYAHRASWLIFRGPIPNGLLVCHTCDVRSCVNPDHLFVGTSSDNLRDMLVKGRAPFQIYPEIYSRIGHTLKQYRKGYHAKAQLSQKDVEVVRYLIERGAFHVDIAKVFGVNPKTIASIFNGRKYREFKQ